MNRLVRNVSAAVLGVLLLCMATLVLADSGKPNERYSRVPAGADGIGKRYMGRDIAGVMGWQGAAWLEREEREREERTDLLVRALQLKPGMVVADIGAGTGYLARRIAPAVTPGGTVLAVDVQPEMVALLQRTVRQSGRTQFQPLLGAEDDVRLPASSVDLAILVDVYHELAFPYEVLGSIVRALKPGGQLVFVEYRAEDPQVPIKALHKMSEVQIKREVAAHPWCGIAPWAACHGSTSWCFASATEYPRCRAAIAPRSKAMRKAYGNRSDHRYAATCCITCAPVQIRPGMCRRPDR